MRRRHTDPDHDLLSTTLEKQIKTNPCDADSDNDGIEDGFEYLSNRDLNDDEYQEPNQTLPAPTPLDATDASTDFDGDSLTMREEFSLWKYSIAHGATRTLTPLTYSDGEQYSVSAQRAEPAGSHPGGHRVRQHPNRFGRTTPSIPACPRVGLAPARVTRASGAATRRRSTPRSTGLR